MPNKPLVSIVIPTQNRENKLKRLLTSIKASTVLPIEIIVERDTQHKGLAYTRNKGAQQAKGKYILFIDDDNVVDKNMINALTKILENDKDISAVGPITYYYTDKKTVWFCGGIFNFITSVPHFYRISELDLQHKDTISTQLLHNCFMVRSTQGKKVGWFDPVVYMGGTELDLLNRIKTKFPHSKWVIAINATCYHDIALPSSDKIRNLGFNHQKRAYYFQRNRGLLIGRYGSLFQKILFSIIFYPLLTIYYCGFFIFSKKYSYLISHLRGTFHGYYLLFTQ